MNLQPSGYELDVLQGRAELMISFPARLAASCRDRPRKDDPPNSSSGFPPLPSCEGSFGFDDQACHSLNKRVASVTPFPRRRKFRAAHRSLAAAESALRQRLFFRPSSYRSPLPQPQVPGDVTRTSIPREDIEIASAEPSLHLADVQTPEEEAARGEQLKPSPRTN